MDLASLAVFRAVATEQSVTRAAERLGRAPSNVSTRIQQLEAEIGAQLFQRDRKRMELTVEGEIYLDYAQRILNLADEAQQVVNPTGPAGVLRVGSMECTVASRLPVPLVRYNETWPLVSIDLSTGPTRQLIEATLAHRIDCALIASPSGEDWAELRELDTVAVFQEELVLVLPPGHPEVRRAADIRPRALAAFAPGCTYRLLAEEWLAGAGFDKDRIAIKEVKSYHAMLACTSAGSCFSVMPRSVLDFTRHVAPFVQKPLMTALTYLACRPGFATPAFAEFRRVLGECSNLQPSHGGAAGLAAADQP